MRASRRNFSSARQLASVLARGGETAALGATRRKPMRRAKVVEFLQGIELGLLAGGDIFDAPTHGLAGPH